MSEYLPRYCAFLRGVNVNGITMKMKDVCAVFCGAGMMDVVSVLASGNIIFRSGLEVEDLKIILQNAMSRRFGYECFLFLKKEEEVFNIFRKNPFSKEDDFHVYALLGEGNAAEVLIREFGNPPVSGSEKAEIQAGTLYWKVNRGNTTTSSFGKVLGRKSMKSLFTSRNINTFEKIIQQFR